MATAIRSTKSAAAATVAPKAPQRASVPAQEVGPGIRTAPKAAQALPNKAVADKAPSKLHENMAKWLEETTGVKPDLKTVQLVCSLRMEFQASDVNQADLAARREAAAKKLQDRVANAQKAAEKAQAKAAAMAAKYATK